MCGSGTFGIEGAWIALNRPPGLTRKRFGFQGWMDYDVRLWTEIRDEARLGVRKQFTAPILCSDVRHDAVRFSIDNAKSAGVGHLLRFYVKGIRDFEPPEGPPGVLVCNPPYGERIGEEHDLRGLYRTLGEVLRQRFGGWRAFVFTGNPRLAECLDMEPTHKIPLYNGRIPCRLLEFRLA
jgi:putative N6-adenine-specific DNA methylase